MIESGMCLLRAHTGDAGSSSEAALPVSVEQVEEYEKSCQKFWAAVKSRMHKVWLTEHAQHRYY